MNRYKSVIYRLSWVFAMMYATLRYVSTDIMPSYTHSPIGEQNPQWHQNTVDLILIPEALLLYAEGVIFLHINFTL